MVGYAQTLVKLAKEFPLQVVFTTTAEEFDSVAVLNRYDIVGFLSSDPLARFTSKQLLVLKDFVMTKIRGVLLLSSVLATTFEQGLEGEDMHTAGAGKRWGWFCQMTGGCTDRLSTPTPGKRTVKANTRLSVALQMPLPGSWEADGEWPDADLQQLDLGSKSRVIARVSLEGGATSYPVVWFREFGKCRVFVTGLPHSPTDPHAVKALHAGIEWAGFRVSTPPPALG